MSQILEYVRQVQQQLTTTAQLPYDYLAWVVGLQMSAVTKLPKYGYGDQYRKLASSLKWVYRARVEEVGGTPEQKWQLAYSIIGKSLKQLKKAAGTLAAGGP